MRTFIQLRDGVGYATLNTPTNIPDHTVTPDHTTAIEVFTDNPEQFLGKKYDAPTNTWSDSPFIRYAELNENGVPIEIRRTVFAYTIPNNVSIMPDEADGSWQVIDGVWQAPVIITEPANPVIIESL